MTASSSVKIQPADSRCRYWAKIFRAGTAFPAPSSAISASTLPGAYLRKGEEELFVGDVLIEGEENSHRRARGWRYLVAWVDSDGEFHRIVPTADHKASLKAQGIDPSLLAGSGDLAACVRIAHGLRAGLII